MTTQKVMSATEKEKKDAYWGPVEEVVEVPQISSTAHKCFEKKHPRF
jgi:hypothetical protein